MKYKGPYHKPRFGKAHEGATIPAVLYFFGGRIRRSVCHCLECCPGCLDCPGLQLTTEDGYKEIPIREERPIRLGHLFGGSDE